MKNLSKISEDAIRRWVDDRSFDRGRGYFRAGNILNPRRQGNTLKARCVGSLPHPYHIDVTLSDQGISHATCSCPVGTGGHCKHVAALLLTWLHTPERFSEVEELEANLRRRSKEELIAIVKRMIAQSPDLESLLELPIIGAKASQPIDRAIIRRQVNTAFGALINSGDFYELEQRLQTLVDIGDDYAGLEAWQDAATVYGTVAERVLANYEGYIDQEGELSYVVEQCIEGLARCLAAATDLRQREDILRMLFDIYFRKAAHIGINMVGIDAPMVILDHATPIERKKVARWVRNALAEEGTSANTIQRQALGGFLLELEMDQLSDEDFLHTCRETGRWHDLVGRLLTLGRVDEAISVAREMGDSALLQLISLFSQCGYGDLAEQLVRERVSQSRAPYLIEWLIDRAQKQGDLEEALQLKEELFWLNATVRRYRELEELARQAGLGEAFNTQRSGIRNLFYDLVSIILERRDAKPRKRRQEFASGQSSDLCAFGLRDSVHLIPLDRRR